MKKISFYFLLFTFYFSLSTPSHAFSLLDFLFPPTQMTDSTRSAPGEAIAPEVVSNDTYSNTLEKNTVTCHSSTSLSNTWEPVQRDTGTTDANGNKIMEYVDYVASGEINGQVDIKNLSNNFYRDFQSFIAKGSIKCTKERAQKNFSSYSLDGSNASLRATSSREISYYRSQLLAEIIRSLDQKNPLDTVVQDYQLAWSCQGSCFELTDTSVSSSSCRPIFLSELLFGLQDEKLYYDSLTSDPTTFPSDLISAVNSYYSSKCSSSTSCYSSRSKGKSFSPLSLDLYKLIYRQINFIPKGNVNSKVTVTNYNDYTQNQTTQTSVDRTLPNAAAASHPYSLSVLSKINPAKQTQLPNNSLCNNVSTNSLITIDQTNPLSLNLFAKDDNFANVKAGDTFTQVVNFDVTSVQDAQTVSTAQTAEQAYANLIPLKASQNTRQQSFSSTTSTNQNNPIPDPGYRADLLYQQMSSYLLPASWQ